MEKIKKVRRQKNQKQAMKNITTNPGYGPFSEAVRRKSLSDFNTQLKANPQSLLEEKTQDGQAVLHVIARFDKAGEFVRFMPLLKEQLNMADVHDSTPFLHAIRAQHMETIKPLAQKGADTTAVNDKGQNAWHFVYNMEVAEFLFPLNKNVAHRDKEGRLCYQSSQFLQHLKRTPVAKSESWPKRTYHDKEKQATRDGDMVKLLTLFHKQGLPLDEPYPDGSTLLFLCCENGFFKSANLLLEYGADLHRLTENGSNIFHYLLAVNSHKEERRKMLEIFIQHGVNYNQKNKEGWTPFLQAVKTGDGDLIKLLGKKKDCNIYGRVGNLSFLSFCFNHQSSITYGEICETHGELFPNEEFNTLIKIKKGDTITVSIQEAFEHHGDKLQDWSQRLRHNRCEQLLRMAAQDKQETVRTKPRI